MSQNSWTVLKDLKAKLLINWTKEDGLMFDLSRLLAYLLSLAGSCYILDLWIARMLLSVTF